MRLEVLDPKKLTLDDMMGNISELYYLHVPEDTLGKPVLTPIGIGGLGLLKSDSLLLRIVPGEVEEMVELEVVNDQLKRTREAWTYKLFSNDPTESIFVEFRPTGDIRVNFKDKESAQAYFDYFREQFYTSTTGASVITVSNIYKDLNLVNWNPEDCDDWGWYTLDNGTCRYITEVLKTRNTKMYGFTLKKPTKLYETKKKGA